MTLLLTRDSMISASPDQLSCEMDGEAVILGLKASTYYSLNPVGARIWEAIQSPTRLDQLLANLLAEYDVDESRCEQEVRRLLGELAAAGLIDVHDAPAA